VYRGGVYVAKKYPVTTFLYAFGMVMMLCATGMSLLPSSEAQPTPHDYAGNYHGRLQSTTTGIDIDIEQQNKGGCLQSWVARTLLPIS
jgi:hypothetical protein